MSEWDERNNESAAPPRPSGNMPDEFDRRIGSLHGLPDVVTTRPSTIREIPDLAVGGTQSYWVQTYRERDFGDTIFLEVTSRSGTTRLVIPPKVANIIARQRDQLTAKARSKSAKATAQARKERGELPAFMKARAK